MNIPEPQLEFTTLVAEVPDSSEAAKQIRRERARAFAQLRRDKAAAQREKREDLIRLLMQLGATHFCHGNYQEAVPQFVRVLGLDPTQTLARETLIIAYMHLQEYESAKDLLIDALRDNPADDWAYTALAFHYGEVHSNYGMAKKLLARALELSPDNAQAHHNLVIAHCATGELCEAEQALGTFTQKVDTSDAETAKLLSDAREAIFKASEP